MHSHIANIAARRTRAGEALCTVDEDAEQAHSPTSCCKAALQPYAPRMQLRDLMSLARPATRPARARVRSLAVVRASATSYIHNLRAGARSSAAVVIVHRRNRGDVTGRNRTLCPEEQQRSSQPRSAENCRSGHTSLVAFPRPVDPKATLSGTAGGIPARPLLRSRIRRAISSRSTAMCWASGPGRAREASRKGSRLRSPLSLTPSSSSLTSALIEPPDFSARLLDLRNLERLRLFLPPSSLPFSAMPSFKSCLASLALLALAIAPVSAAATPVEGAREIRSLPRAISPQRRWAA